MSVPASGVLARSNVRVSGKSQRAIVFLHGLGSPQSMWHALAAAFEDRYQVVLLDLVGADQPDEGTRAPRRATLAGHAHDLLGVMSALALHDAVFVGHSVGALIGVLAAIREPQRFVKMVLISPSPRFLSAGTYAGGSEQADVNELLTAMEGAHRGWSQGPAPVAVGKDERPELVLKLTNSFVRTNPEIARHFARVTPCADSRAASAFLTIPTLIVQSAHDVVAPLAVGHYLNEQLADSRLAVVETSGHCPHLSAPQATYATVDTFLHRETLLG